MNIQASQPSFSYELNKRQRIINNSLLILFCIAVNIGCSLSAFKLQLPVWLDSVGVCLAAYFTGPLGALIVSVAHHLYFSITMSAMALPFLSVSIIIIVCISFFTYRGYLENIRSTLIASFVLTVFCTICAFTVSYIFSDGTTGNYWGDVLYDMLKWRGESRIICSISSCAFIEVVDKPLCVFLSFLLIHALKKMPSFRCFFKKTAAMCLALIVFSCTLSPVSTHAEDVLPLSINHTVQFYNLQNGMPFSTANTIAETDDGYIWIGSYSGLARFNGRIFESVDLEGFSSIIDLLVDQRGRVWVGTIDNGVCILENGELIAHYDNSNGIENNQIYSMAEKEDGNVYVGTASGLFLISAEGTEKVSDVGEIPISVIPDGNRVIYTTYDGELIITGADKEDADRLQLDDDKFTCLLKTSEGLFAGTNSGKVITLIPDGNTFRLGKTFQSSELHHINSLSSDSSGRIWICADDGFGYLSWDGKIYVEEFEKFNHSIEEFHEDYQGNLWFTSSNYGVMKLSVNPFTNLFEVSGITPAAVNSVSSFDSKLFCGTDDGLVVLNEKNYALEDHELLNYTKDARVRSSMTDSSGAFWLCTYGEYGLIRYDPADGSISYFTPDHGGTEGGAFRCMTELSDKTIVAGTTTGVNFIRDGEVIHTIAAQDKLEGRLVLCLKEAADKSLYVCIDGAGIFVVKDGDIVDHITTDDGLSSNVIMRLIPYKGGFFAVSSNGLNYLDENGILSLDQFPSHNTYDILIDQDRAYVIIDRGIISVDAEDLRKNYCKNYSVYDVKNGLHGTPMANSWNFVDETGLLFFCCNDGACTLPLREHIGVNDLKYGLTAVYADTKLISCTDDIYQIPSETKTLEIEPSLFHYGLDNIKMRVYVEDFTQIPRVFTQDTLTALSISNLPTGEHTLHFQIISEDESTVIEEKVFTLVREPHAWENKRFKFYLRVVILWLAFFFTNVLMSIASLVRRKKNLEIMRLQLEEKVAQQTSEIRAQSEKMTAFQWSVVESMAGLIESRDNSTGTHVVNTRKYTDLLARALKKRGLYKDEIDNEFIYLASHVAPLHDVGKIKISDTILNKPGRFTPEEFEIMKQHSQFGKEVVKNILGPDTEPKMLKMACDIAVYHHEKWDGSGYPYGLKGEQIPLCARIMAVADVFDALISKRVYKDAMDVEEAFRIMQEGSGKHFDPTLIEVFCEEKEQVLRISKSNES